VRPYQLSLPRLVTLVLLLILNAACSGTNLGEIDESVDSREEMPGPGILADEEGETALKWSSGSSEAQSASESTAASTAASAAAPAAVAADAGVTQEQAEFEQFKTWNELRSNGTDSAEYQEFQQWLEYQKFKSSQ